MKGVCHSAGFEHLIVGLRFSSCSLTGPPPHPTVHPPTHLPQLFVPASSDDEVAVAGAACAGARGPAAQLLSYPNGLDSWPERMRPVVQWGEGANMKDRVPLHSRLAELAGPASGAHPLTATRVADLHPFSW